MSNITDPNNTQRTGNNVTADGNNEETPPILSVNSRDKRRRIDAGTSSDKPPLDGLTDLANQSQNGLPPSADPLQMMLATFASVTSQLASMGEYIRQVQGQNPQTNHGQALPIGGQTTQNVQATEITAPALHGNDESLIDRLYREASTDDPSQTRTDDPSILATMTPHERREIELLKRIHKLEKNAVEKEEKIAYMQYNKGPLSKRIQTTAMNKKLRMPRETYNGVGDPGNFLDGYRQNAQFGL